MPATHPRGDQVANSDMILTNEFASVRVAVDHRGHTPRLFVEDLETGAATYLDPLELASFCQVEAMDRAAWLRVGQYRVDESA